MSAPPATTAATRPRQEPKSNRRDETLLIIETPQSNRESGPYRTGRIVASQEMPRAGCPEPSLAWRVHPKQPRGEGTPSRFQRWLPPGASRWPPRASVRPRVPRCRKAPEFVPPGTPLPLRGAREGCRLYLSRPAGEAPHVHPRLRSFGWDRNTQGAQALFEAERDLDGPVVLFQLAPRYLDLFLMLPEVAEAEDPRFALIDDLLDCRRLSLLRMRQ